MSYLFWVTTLAPGLGLLLTVWPGLARRGALGALAWSFVLTLGLLTPVVAVAYLARGSAAAVALVYAALVAAGAAAILRPESRRTIRGMLRCTPRWEVLIALAAVLATVPLGGTASEDSFVHAAKIRYLRDVEFSIQDPYSPLQVIESRHHVNTLQSMHALASWFTRDEPLRVWFESAWFFRLLALGGVSYLVGMLFRSNWIGAVAMLASVGVICSAFNISYPSVVSAYVVVPLLLAQVVTALHAPTRAAYALVVVASLALAVVHIGYWLITAMCLTPAVATWLLWRRKDDEGRLQAALSLGPLSVGVPFLLVTALSPSYIAAQEAGAHDWMLRVVDLAAGWRITILDPTHYGWMLPTVAATALLWIAHPLARSRYLIPAAALLASMVYMFTPILFDALTSVLPHWLIRRARYLGEVVGYASVGGGIAWIARPRLRDRTTRTLFAVVVLSAGLASFRTGIQGFVLGVEDEMAVLDRADRLHEVVAGVPEGALVAASPELSLMLPAVHPVRVMSPERFNANPADSGLVVRFEDARRLLGADASAEERRALIARHGIDYILVGVDTPEGVPGSGLEAVASTVVERNGLRLLEVRE